MRRSLRATMTIFALQFSFTLHAHYLPDQNGVSQARAQTFWGAGAQTKKGPHRQNDLSINRCNLKLASNWLLRNT